MNNRRKKLVLVGGGGHCKSVLDTVINTRMYSEVAIIDKKENVGKKVLNTPIIGCDEELPRFYQEGYMDAFVTAGSIGDTRLRIRLFTMLEKMGFYLPNLVDRSAMVSLHATLSRGIFVGKNAVINAGSHIHEGAIINTSTTIEHDCVIDAFAHIGPGTVLCGAVRVGTNTHVGANSAVKQQVSIGANTIIGMGSNVLTNIASDVVAYGNPCREVRSN